MFWHIETDIFALAIFIAMFIKSHLFKGEKTHQEVGFDIVLNISVGVVALDILSSFVMEFCTNWWIYQIVMSVYMAALPVLPMTWACYVVGLISANDQKWAWRAITSMAIPLQVYVLFAVTNFFTGFMFTLSPDLVYEHGPLFLPLSAIFILGYTAVGVCLTLIYRKRIKPDSHVIVLLVAFGMSMVSIAVQLLMPGILIVCATYATVYVLCDATIQEQRRRDLLTDLSEAVESAEQANDAKTQFFARMSHDMRTPLNGILGISTLMRDKVDDPDLENDLEQLSLSGQYLLHLVNDTLDISKIEAGQMDLHPMPTDPVGLASNVGTNALTLANEKGVVLEMTNLDSASIDTSMIVIDGSRLEQVLMNIISNAIKFTPSGGHVRLDFRMNPSEGDKSKIHYHFSISDNGPGMDADFIPKLFDPYSQEARTAVDSQGTGLGMSIVKRLVDLMGGTIDVISTVDVGTTVRLDFDFERYEGTAQAQAEPVDLSNLTGKHVLLVEDHPINARISTQLLQKKAVEVDWAADGKKGVDAFAESEPYRYDIVLMDIRMPVMNGLESARAIRALDRPDARTVPIVALTANAFADDIEATKAAGMNGHVAKPVDPDLLYKTISDLLR